VKQAEAGYRAAKARLSMAISGARPQEVAQARAAADAAQAAYVTAKSAYERFHGLYKEGVIPKQQEEQVELQYNSAKAARDAADAKLDMVREGARKEEIEAAREGVRAAEAQLRMARDAALQINLRQQDVQAAGWKASAAKGQLDEAEAYMSETKIISPISGYISERMSDSGEMISAGFPILSVVKGRDFKVKVYADESKFGYIKLGDPVKVIIPALAGREFTGKIIRVSQAADFAVKKATNEQGSFDVRSLQLVVKLADVNPEFRNGMTARVKLAVSKR
jgi:HlyD family secretion protein